MHFDVYSSPEKDVWYTTGRRPANSSISTLAEVNKVGNLDIHLTFVDKKRISNGDEKEQSSSEDNFTVTFNFSRTEIQVKAFDPMQHKNKHDSCTGFFIKLSIIHSIFT